jgi:hypothetical protein
LTGVLGLIEEMNPPLDGQIAITSPAMRTALDVLGRADGPGRPRRFMIWCAPAQSARDA